MTALSLPSNPALSDEPHPLDLYAGAPTPGHIPGVAALAMAYAHFRSHYQPTDPEHRLILDGAARAFAALQERPWAVRDDGTLEIAGSTGDVAYVVRDDCHQKDPRHPLQPLAMPRRIWLVAIALGLLAGCARLPTYGEAQATARAGGCWPDYLPTPPPVTVTPAGSVGPGTPLPTATALAICPPRPGRTAVVWPTPVPAPPPFPTAAGRPWQTGSGQATTLRLPTAVLAFDLAVHPTAGWPAVGAVVWAGTTDPERVLVSVYNPIAARWSVARQVDLGPAQIGRFSRTVRMAISGHGRVTAVWGMSDPDFADHDPPAGIWASDSDDYGETWRAPTRIAAGCRRVNDVVADTDGRLAVLLVCDAGQANDLGMVRRDADGAWQPLERLPVATNYFSESSLVLVGSGDAATVVGLTLVMAGGAPMAYLLRRPLDGATSARIARIALNAPADWQLGARMWNLRGLAFTRPSGPGVVFSFTDADGGGGAYALTSLDGGASWGGLARIAAPPTSGFILSAVPAYDPAADRLAAVWSCCAGGVLSATPATHYASWSVPGSGIWQALGGATPIPLVLGSRLAGETTAAQAANSRHAWVAWVEGLQQVEVRSLDLNQLIPVAAYPTATPFPSPVVAPEVTP